MTNSYDRFAETSAIHGTAQREAERRAGPNPRSAHPTGPHAPYEPGDPNGIAAEKHYSDTVPDTPAADEQAPRPSGTIKIIDTRR